MERDVFSYLDKGYRFLNNYIREFNKTLFISPHSAIIQGRMFAEKLIQEASNIEGYGLLVDMTQSERLSKLENEKVIQVEIDNSFHAIRMIGNKATYACIEEELEAALNIHRNIYKIACWFVKKYIDIDFNTDTYKTPMPSEENSSNIDSETILNLIKKMDSITSKTEYKNDEQTTSNYSIKEKDEAEEIFEDLRIESIFDIEEINKKCLVQELSKLKESSKEAVEGLGEFTTFKKYMHIKREAQIELDNLIIKANESKKSQLILVCGSVGDGKSHIISYFKNKYAPIMNNFTLHNDATESLEPNKTSMDTLNEILDNFSDENIEESNEKIILAINLGTLNNFIDSKYGERFSVLKSYVYDKKILETSIEENGFDDNSSLQFVNFSDYHVFTLKNEKVHSDYIKELINKITDSSDLNIFHSSYKRNCSKCTNCDCCPIKANYELLSTDNVQESIMNLLVQCIIKSKIIVSTRALLNFMYELIIPRSYIDVNSPRFKTNIAKLNDLDYIKSLMPNIIFNHKELSFIFEAFSILDPLNVRNEKVDDFIIEFNNSLEILPYFNKYIDYPKGYLYKLRDKDFSESEYTNVRHELLKLFIRSYYICGKGELFSLMDLTYENFMNNLYFWNRGEIPKLKNLYDDVRDGIIKWNGEADKEQINIFMGKNQIKYKVSQDLKLKVDTSGLPKSDEVDLKKFITTIKLKYQSQKLDESYEIELDFSLYKLLIQVINGYRPNKKDKNHFIKFIEFINKLEDIGSQNEKVIFTEKNNELNKKYKLEYDTVFKFYKFMEI